MFLFWMFVSNWWTFEIIFQFHALAQGMLSWFHEFMNSWIHEFCSTNKIDPVSRYMKIRWCFHDFMNSWIHDLSRYMKIRWCFHEFMNSWLIKVHENQVMKYESNICTAIIKVHENQVMQNLDHDGKWHDFATLTNCTANSWIHDLSRYMKISISCY